MNTRFVVLSVLYLIFVTGSFFMSFNPGVQIGKNFIDFASDFIILLPCAFVLIGLLEVWVKKETIENHMGSRSRFSGYFWAVLLAGFTVGGLYVAFPVAYSLYKKNARLSVIFTYINAAAIFRIPMTVFEITSLGLKFSLIRLLLSLPLVICFSLLLEKFLKNHNFTIKDGS